MSLKIKWSTFWVLKITKLFRGKFWSKLKADRFAEKFYIKGWSFATVKVMKLILTRNIHASRKEAKLVKNKNVNKKRKRNCSESKCRYFSTLSPILYLFLTLQFFTISSVKKVETVYPLRFLSLFRCRYFTANYFRMIVCEC